MTIVASVIAAGLIGWFFGRAVERDLWQWSYLTDTPVKIRGNSYRVIPEPTYQRITGTPRLPAGAAIPGEVPMTYRSCNTEE